LTKAACSLLEIEASELQAEYRLALTKSGQAGLESEIYLYDTLPGGAGFSRRVGDLGISVFEKALKFMELCPDDCDRSCYRCLRSYKNKFEHDLIDRVLGSYLLRYVITGEEPIMDQKRINSTYEMLYQDLARHDNKEFRLSRNQRIDVPGIGELAVPILATKEDGVNYVIGLHGSMSPNQALDVQLREIIEYSTTLPVILVDELKVRRNLPRASNDVINALL
jgi:hypothetical protein